MYAITSQEHSKMECAGCDGDNGGGGPSQLLSIVLVVQSGNMGTDECLQHSVLLYGGIPL